LLHELVIYTQLFLLEGGNDLLSQVYCDDVNES
jgi:hypothetical protein